MTVAEAKDQVAQKHYYDRWENLCPNGNLDGVPDKWVDEVIELYTRAKWDEAAEAQKMICSDALNQWEFGGRSTVHHFKDVAKPEFKP